MPYLIEPIISLNEINVIFGVQGTGKTNCAFQLYRCIIDKRPFFGYPCCDIEAGQLGYCAYDRSHAKCGELLTKYGLKDLIPWKSFRDIPSPDVDEPYPLEWILQKHFKGVKILLVDGAGLLIPKGRGNDYQHVGSFLRYAGFLTTKYNVTFIFILHSGKVKADSGILNARQAVIGSTIYGGMAEGMIQVDHLDHTNLTDPRRVINFIPHDSVPRKILVQFSKDYGFEELNLEDIYQAKECWFRSLPDVFQKSEAIEAGDQYQLKERTVESYLTEYVESGLLFRTTAGKGIYKKLNGKQGII